MKSDEKIGLLVERLAQDYTSTNGGIIRDILANTPDEQHSGSWNIQELFFKRRRDSDLVFVFDDTGQLEDLAFTNEEFTVVLNHVYSERTFVAD